MKTTGFLVTIFITTSYRDSPCTCPSFFSDSRAYREVGLEDVGDAKKGEHCMMAAGKGWEME